MNSLESRTSLLLGGSTRLVAFVKEGLAREAETSRLCLASLAFMMAGGMPVGDLPDQIANRLQKTQQKDGGWKDTEDSAICVRLLSELGTCSSSPPQTEAGLAFIRGCRTNGGWGRHPRDQTRIITTALVIALVPEAATEADWNWLRQEWRRDLERPVKLSYKGGFYLLAEKRDVEPTLPEATIRFLEEDQNDDGGFGPWRDHPIGSDPWSTGVVLWGLSRWIDRVDRKVIERALDWLERNQLPSGYWPYHYLDEGTSYALIGAVSALKALQRL